jgi:exosortase A-associated hydrolase 1
MRQIVSFPCAGEILSGTVDMANGTTGLLVVSGGNEIRSGAYAGQSRMAAHFASLGVPVFRFDSRGVGDSSGSNRGFEHSADDIKAAIAAFRTSVPQMTHIWAFGNCDAAASLLLYPEQSAFSALILANIWSIDPTPDAGETPAPNVAAIRARYWNRLKNPRSLIDLLTGKIDLRKLLGGLKSASAPAVQSQLGKRLADALANSAVPIDILIAERDTTAIAFMSAWKSRDFERARRNADIHVSICATASHSFADPTTRSWLYAHIEAALKQQR